MKVGSDPSYCKEHKLWYPLSKSLAENAASKFMKDHGIDMVAIIPGTVFGPVLQPLASLSISWILNLVNDGLMSEMLQLHTFWPLRSHMRVEDSAKTLYSTLQLADM